MLIFEFTEVNVNARTDEELVGLAYYVEAFNVFVYTPLYNDFAETSREKVENFFEWLGYLPYEATSCPESLLQCLLYYAKQKTHSLVNPNPEFRSLITGLQVAITGVPLVNQKSRILWLYGLHTLLFNFEAMFKMRNLNKKPAFVPYINVASNGRAFGTGIAPDVRFRDLLFYKLSDLLHWSKDERSD
jgi:hypothetical protein